MKAPVRLEAVKAGFTIVETMVVLAVTGALFVAIAATFTGKQSQAEFDHAINNAQFQIQQAINQVEAGYYPNLGNFSCSRSGGNVSITYGSSQAQGTNGGCVFMGKVIQFTPNTGSANEERYIYTIAGADITGASTPPFGAVDPTAVATIPFQNYADVGAWQYGLRTVSVCENGTPQCSAAVGFLIESKDLSSGSASTVTGNPQVDVVLIQNVPFNATPLIAVSKINNSLQSNAVIINPSTGIGICLASGTTNQSGLITIGGTGRQLIVKLDIRSNTSCS